MTSEFWIEGSLRRPRRPRPREEASHTGCRRRDLGAGLWDVEGMADTDLPLAEHWHRRHKALRMGLVDAVVAVVADRLQADVIATLDLRHFGSSSLPGTPPSGRAISMPETRALLPASPSPLAEARIGLCLPGSARGQHDRRGCDGAQLVVRSRA